MGLVTTVVNWAKDNETMILIVLGLLAVIVGLLPTVISLMQRQRRIIDYSVETDIHLLSSRAPAVEDVTVRYKDVPVHKPRVVEVRFENTGARSVKDGDYTDAITVEQKKGNKPLDAFIVEQR